MASIRRLLLLLDEVLPSFAAGGKSEASETNSEPDEHAINLRAELFVLESNVSALLNQLGEVGRSVNVLHEVLGFLEDALDETQIQIPPVVSQSSEYPKLEYLRASCVANKLEDIPHLTKSIHADHGRFADAAGRFTKWNEALTQQIKHRRGEREPPKRTRKPSGIVRKFAGSLHRVVGDLWQCRCTAPHDGMLFVATHRQCSESDNSMEFDMICVVDPLETGSLRECKILVEGEVWYPSGPSDDVPAIQYPRGRGSNTRPRKIGEVHEVCHLLGNAPAASRSSLLLEEEKLWRARPLRPRLKKLSSFEGLATLGDLLNAKVSLTKKTKLVLAVLIARSFFYYRDGPWLPSGWNKDDFRFLQSSQYTLFQPLLAARFGNKPISREARSGSIHASPDLLALGVLLLELFLQESIEDLRDFDEDGEDDGSTTDLDFFTAGRLLDSSDWDTHVKYSDAVSACLEIERACSDDAEFGDFFFNEVILPLEQELESIFGMSLNEIDAWIMQNGALNLKDNTVSQLSTPEGGIMSNQSTISSRGNEQDDDAVDSQLVSVYSAGSLDLITTTIMNDSCFAKNSNEKSKRVAFRLPNDAAQAPKKSEFTLFDDAGPSDRAQAAERWFKRLQDEVHPVLPERDPNSSVKVAILDTGINMNHWEIATNRGRITSKKSFVPGTKSADTDGHGTHVASLILRVAPNVEVFIAKITDDNEALDASCIAEAIRHATDTWHVDIINMSFGYPRRKDRTDCIQTAIKHAHYNNVIMFAAASNNGGLDGIAYPANQDEVICINSTDGEGNKSSFNPSPVEGRNISVLGQDVEVPGLGADGSKRKSGTSFATPVAVGVAAFVIDFVRQSDGKTGDGVEARIAERKGMLAVLRKICFLRDGYWFLTPWSLFCEGKRDRIAHLIRETLYEEG